MTVTVASFRQSLTEFASTSVFPDSGVAFWLGVAALMLDPLRWGQPSAAADVPPTSLMDFGVIMFAAHNLALERANQKSAAAGGVPGTSMSGPVSSKTIGPVSQSYDSQAGIELEAGHWNLTNYGTRFVRLANIIGSGPLTAAGCRPLIPYSGSVWPGPPVGVIPWFGDAGF
jgi:hypothetical protein